MEPFRIEPNMPPSAYQTYVIDKPRDTMVRSACEEVGCLALRNGWRTIVDESTDLGQAQGAYIRHRSRRTFKEVKTAEGLTVFTFDSGQRCFSEHQTRAERYGVLLGDHRNYFGVVRDHARAADWVEDFGEHQQEIADQIEKG